MSEFSNKLEEYIINSGLMENQLAKVTGFSRSYIARLKNGQRISPDIDKITRLFDALNLTPQEYKLIWNLYLEERYGKDRYALIMAVQDFIASFRYACVASDHTGLRLAWNEQEEEIQVVEGHEDVRYMLRMMAVREASRAEGHLRCLMQAEDSALMETLKDCFKLNSHFRADQILCLERSMENKGSAQLYNMSQLKAIVPVILSCSNADYRVYYYYDNVSAHLNQFSAMPLFLITEDTVVTVDYNCERAVFLKNEDVRQMYCRIFDEMAEGCASLYRYINSETTLFQQYEHSVMPDNAAYFMGMQPCFGVLDANALIDRYIKPGKEDLAQSLKKVMTINRSSVVSDATRLVTYFTEEGLDQFVRYGIVDELPMDMYTPVSEEDRIRMLDGLLAMAELGTYEPRLINTKKFTFTKGVNIDAFDFANLTIYYNVSSCERRFIIQEKTLARMFYQFMQDFKESTFVCSREESIRCIREKADVIRRE